MKRPREYLTEKEIERLMDAARQNRWGHRDATAILIAGAPRGTCEGAYCAYKPLRATPGDQTSTNPIIGFS
jgi:hypothetical protein